MTRFTVLRLIFLAAFLVAGRAVYAQQPQIHATTDQQVYVSGERIWVSGKLIAADALGTAEITVYLLNRRSGILSRQKTLSRDGLFFVNMPVMPQTPSDNYAVAIALGNSFRVFIPVMIINPVIPPEKTGAAFGDAVVANENVKPLVLNVAAQEWTSRQQVNVNVDTPSGKLDYFVSVTRVDALSVYADSLFSGWAFAPGQEVPDADGMGLQINATVLDGAGKPVADVPVISSLLSNQADIGYSVTDLNGKLRITHPYHFTDPPLVFTSLSTQPGLKIVLEQEPDSLSFSMNLPPLELSERFEQAISERVTNSTVGQAYLSEQKTRLVTGQVDTTDFYGKPDKRYILDNYTRFPDMQEILQEFVPEVRVRRIGGKAILQVVNLPFKVFFEQGALVLLDGVPVTDIEQLLTLDPLKISMIDVVTRKFFLGHLQLPGIVHYKTYKTDLAGYKLSANQVVFDYKGLGLPVVPAYPANTPARIPDLRNTLYWGLPGALTKGGFSFSTLDAKGKYMVWVTGVDERGNKYAGKQEIVLK